MHVEDGIQTTLEINGNSGRLFGGLACVLVDEHTNPSEKNNHEANCQQTGNHCVINKHEGFSASMYVCVWLKNTHEFHPGS